MRSVLVSQPMEIWKVCATGLGPRSSLTWALMIRSDSSPLARIRSATITINRLVDYAHILINVFGVQRTGAERKEVVNEATLSTEDFRYAFRGHPAGVGVVTADAGDGPVAMTVSSLFSVGLEPPTLVFSASALSSATPVIRRAETVVVHLIGSEQVSLAQLGATSNVDRFGEGVEWDRLPTGEPYYPGAESWLRGRISELVDAGGSTVVVVEALQGKPREFEDEVAAPSPLVYHNRTWHKLGEHSKLAV